ncbi:MAG TPA: hypothetical protein VLX58_11125 [Bryobacteraceae bacterium]|nr:hypothetical protein [Bryobacteraceae bacterium]
MVLALLLTLAAPADWVPARWRWLETKTLELLSGTPINCLLIDWNAQQKAQASLFAVAASERGIATLAVIRPGGDAAEPARDAVRAKLTGVVLEGDFPEDVIQRVRAGVAPAPVIELTLRSRMPLGANEPVIGTYQGVWPGIPVLEDGAAKAGPSGSPWINTNSGFLRAARAFGDSAVWMANLPPPKTVITGENYAQVIGDAEMVGARWVIALDDDLARRLHDGDKAAAGVWSGIARQLQFYEDHREWRAYPPYGKLAVVQGVNAGALLSGGILDMIGARHTPVRAVPPERLQPDALAGASMAVDVDSASLTPEQREVLKAFTRSGGTLLTGPADWKEGATPGKDQITLDDKQLKRLDDIWHDINSMIGRNNLGVRLFNVSSMLSNLLVSRNGKQEIVQLVNYSNYPVESVTVHALGDFHHARLYTPGAPEKKLEVYKVDEGTGVDIDLIKVSATLLLE